MLEIASEDRGAGIADGGKDDGELSDELAPDAIQGLDAYDQADAGHAGDDAKTLAPGGGLMPGDGDGDEEGEDGRGRVENGCKAGIDSELGPGNEGEGQYAVDGGLGGKEAPAGEIARQMEAAQLEHKQQQGAGNQRAPGDEGHGWDGFDPDFDESVGGAPERCQHGQEQKFETERTRMGRGGHGGDPNCLRWLHL
jgi:hypothetical protein